MLARLGPRFLGWDIGEQDGRYVGSYALRHCPGSRTRREAYKQFARFMHRIGEDHFHHTNCLLGLYLAHHVAHTGDCRLLGAETAQMLPSVPPWYACIRGAGKQYGILWFGNVSIFNRWGVKSFKKDEGYAGPDRGPTESLIRRLFLVEFLYGSCILSLESAVDRSGGITPLGVMQREAFQWCSEQSDIGVQHTPVALMMDFYSGWQPPRAAYLLNWPHRSAWGEIDYTAGDHQVDQVFRLIWPGYEDCSYYRDERGFLTPTPVGDIFDVLTTNVGSPVLGQYSCACVLGDIEVEGRLWVKLRRFLEDGGELIVAVNQLGDEPLSELGIELVELKEFSGCVDLEGNAVDEKPFTYWHARTKRGKVLLQTATGDPLAFEIPLGTGRVCLVMVPYGLSRPDEDFRVRLDSSLTDSFDTDPQAAKVWGEDEPILSPYSLLSSIENLLLSRFNHYGLVDVDGPPIQYITNLGQHDDQLVVSLVNNSDQEWQGQLSLRSSGVRRIEYLLTDTNVPEKGPVVVPPGDIRVLRMVADRLIMQFREPPSAKPGQTRLAAWTRVDPGKNLEANIELLRRTDVPGVEISIDQVLHLPDEELRLLTEQLVEAELDVVALNLVPAQTPFSGYAFGSNNPADRRSTDWFVQRVPDIALRLGARRLIVSPGGWDAQQGGLERCAADIAELARRVRMRGVDVIVEMAPAFFLERTAPWLPPPDVETGAKLVDAVGQPNVWAALNLGHVRCLGQDPVKVADALGDRLRYVQLNACRISLGGAPLDEHLPFQQDLEHAKALFGHLVSSGFSGVVCLDSSWTESPLSGLRAGLAEVRTLYPTCDQPQ